MNKTEARAELLKILQPGSTVYSNVIHVSKSGMLRVLDLYVALIDDNGHPYIRRISWLAHHAAELCWNSRHEGVSMSGCGYNVCFEAVYRLGLALWPDGTPEPHGTRNGEPDSNGGYALKEVSL